MITFVKRKEGQKVPESIGTATKYDGDPKIAIFQAAIAKVLSEFITR